MLDKPLFDCNDIGEFYDCGCEDHETTEADEGEGGSENQPKDQRTGDEDNTSPPVEISKEP